MVPRPRRVGSRVGPSPHTSGCILGIRMNSTTPYVWESRTYVFTGQNGTSRVLYVDTVHAFPCCMANAHGHVTVHMRTVYRCARVSMFPYGPHVLLTRAIVELYSFYTSTDSLSSLIGDARFLFFYPFVCVASCPFHNFVRVVLHRDPEPFTKNKRLPVIIMKYRSSRASPHLLCSSFKG